MARSPAGLRIRERRTALGLSQVDLAQRAGISPSYLNLIEKNRRGAAGKVLLALARALETAPADLTGGSEDDLLSDLREAAATHGRPALTAEEFFGRFPDWARILAALGRENRALRDAVAALSDRMTHDPFLGQSVHRLLTNVTAIRSLAEILADPAGVEAGQQARFIALIAEEGGRLSGVAEALAAYFDRAGRDEAPAATPEEALDRFLEAHGHHFPDIDREPLGQHRNLLTHPALEGAAAQALARQHLARYAADATLLPLHTFAEAGARAGWDPIALARAFAAPLLAVFRRLATLRRAGIEAPAFGALQLTAAGHTEFRRPLPDLPLPRHGAACPLWPLFDALTRTETPVARLCRMPDGSETMALAVAETTGPAGFEDPPRLRAGMLLIPRIALPDIRAPLPPPGRPRPVGPGCRLCPRKDCDHRAGPSLLG